MWRMCSWSTPCKPVRMARWNNSRRRTPPLLRYIIYQFSISRKTDISEGMILETFKIYFLVS